MTPESVVGLLAEPARLRVFSAIVLGATSPSAVAAAAGVPEREAGAALRRLQRGGLVDVVDGGFRARAERFKEVARAAAPPEPAVRHGAGDDRVESILHAFVRGDRLIGVPAQHGRRRVVLAYLAARSFRPGVTYDERAVNDVLRTWCEGAPTDHVTVRRYLVDHCLLGREAGRYWLRTEATASSGV